MEKSICLSIISGGSMKTTTVSCILDMMRAIPAPINLILPVGGYAAQNRTMAIRMARKTKNTHIMFIDGDMIFPPDGVAKLLKQDKDIIGANYNQRQLPLISTVKMADKDGNYRSGSSKEFPKVTFEVAAIGTGYCLINMNVFDKVPEPWFASGYFDGNLIDFNTEDIYFCKEAKKAGFKVWCDPTLILKHVGDFLY